MAQAISLEQSTTLWPFMGQAVILVQIARRTGQHNIIHIMPRTCFGTTDGNGVLNVIDIPSIAFFKLGMSACGIVAAIMLCIEFFLDLPQGKRPRCRFLASCTFERLHPRLVRMVFSPSRRSLVIVLSVGFSVLSQLRRMGSLIVVNIPLGLFYMLFCVLLIIFRFFSVVLLGVFLTAILTAVAETIFSAFIAVEVFGSSRVPLLTFRARIAAFQWYKWYTGIHSRTLQVLLSRSGLASTAPGHHYYSSILFQSPKIGAVPRIVLRFSRDQFIERRHNNG